MNGKKLIALLLALCLALTAFPALAAPTRDIRAIEVTADEKLLTLVDIACEAIPEECFGAEARIVLEKDQVPDAYLTEQALWAAVLMTRESLRLTAEEAGQLYRQIFTCGEFDPAVLAGSDLPFIMADEDALEVNPEVRPLGFGGAYLYEITFDGTDALVRCDLYTCQAEGADVNEAPEEWVTWACCADLSLRFAPETEFGYTVNSISLSPRYRDGNFGDWWEAENTELEYAVNLPGSLEPADETPEHWVFKNAEGDVSLTIDAKEEDLTYDQALAAFMSAHPGKNVRQERLYDAFILTEAGLFVMVVTADGYPWTYTVTLAFPAERQAEYEFYAEIIRNSFGVWGLSNG